MRVLATARTVIAVLVIANYPPGLALWLVIHPFAAFWRRLGAVWTYVILSVPTLAYMAGVVLLRNVLLMRDLGTHWVPIVLAVFCIGAALLIFRHRRKQLTYSKLSGIPELSQEDYPGTLLTEGIYSWVRHPRYIEAYLWTLAYAFFSNYLGAYLMVLLSIPVIIGVVVLEERELRQRFGEAYEDYCRRVPRFIPRLGGRKPAP